jgi:hypothetical protein
MTNPRSDDSSLPVVQTELVTKDIELLCGLSRQVCVEHTTRFDCADPHLASGRVNWAVTDSVAAGLLDYTGLCPALSLSRSTCQPRRSSSEAVARSAALVKSCAAGLALPS